MKQNKTTFKEYLFQSVGESKNVHLSHIEDEILEFSYQGARNALTFIESIAGMLAGHSNMGINITEKWDGSPAIVVGTNPENGKFFVSTKSIFNKKPKINYTVEDIRKNHGNSELSRKLSIALIELEQLNITGILQGDMMFTKDDLDIRIIDETQYITFTPNTITYAIPYNSYLGERITNSNLGIIFHTSYLGESLNDLKASFKVNLENLNHSPTVWCDDATYLDESGTVTLTEDETDFVFQHLEVAEDIFEDLQEADLDAMVNHPELVDMIKIYANKNIREGKAVVDPRHWVDQLVTFIHDRIETEKQKLKTEAAKERWEKKKQGLHTFIENERVMLEQVFEFQYHITAAKKILLQKLHTLSEVNTFIETPEGYKATTPEGFVAVDHLTERAVKLVDRLEFSRANFKRNKKDT